MKFALLILACAILTALMHFCSVAQSQSYESDTVSGDANWDNQICMDDSILLIHHLFFDGRPLPCPDAGDVDRDGYLTTNDCLAGLYHVFLGYPIPDCPVSCSE